MSVCLHGEKIEIDRKATLNAGLSKQVTVYSCESIIFSPSLDLHSSFFRLPSLSVDVSASQSVCVFVRMYAGMPTHVSLYT